MGSQLELSLADASDVEPPLVLVDGTAPQDLDLDTAEVDGRLVDQPGFPLDHILLERRGYRFAVVVVVVDPDVDIDAVLRLVAAGGD